MEKFLKYAVLRYSPSTVAGEKINLGIIFYEEDINYREFRFTKNFARLTKFDDEIDVKLVKKLMSGIKEEVEAEIYDYKPFDIDKYIQYYINDFCFERTKTIKYDDLEDTIERLNKTYFRFDYEKSERPSKLDDRRILEQLIISQGKSLKSNHYVYGRCNDKIKYDIVTDEYNIKIFDFDDKKLNLLVNNAKTWAWNTMFGDSKKTIIIYRFNDANSEYGNEFKTIMNIFEHANADVYDIDEGIQFLQCIS